MATGTAHMQSDTQRQPAAAADGLTASTRLRVAVRTAGPRSRAHFTPMAGCSSCADRRLTAGTRTPSPASPPASAVWRTTKSTSRWASRREVESVAPLARAWALDVAGWGRRRILRLYNSGISPPHGDLRAGGGRRHAPCPPFDLQVAGGAGWGERSCGRPTCSTPTSCA